MTAPTTVRELVLEDADNRRLANLVGPMDENLHQLEERLHVDIRRRGGRLRIAGSEASTRAADQVLQSLYALSASEPVTAERVHLYLQEANAELSEPVVEMPAVPAQRPASPSGGRDESRDEAVVHTQRGGIRGRGPNQRAYLDAIRTNDLTFGIGPAGTGKTYLAVASAVAALQTDRVRRIVLVRPAVEAGERLGFLPGDLTQKVDPYLRPMYDALYDMMGFDRVTRAIERNVIEVAPLAFMRGRSLNDSFVILDEAQNTSIEQMKMFLTRIGFGSKAVVTGDITQTDLPRGQVSGLKHVIDILHDIEGVAFTFFSTKDIVRHPLVQRIVAAYERAPAAGRDP